MSNEEILKLAQEANFFVRNGVIYYGNVGLQTCLAKFAALVQRATAEDCAQLCNQVAWSNRNTQLLGPEMNAQKCEFAIRTKYQEPKSE